MKKCPKCGTILDDSKVKCYVCGTDLQRQTLTHGDSFNEKIGATVSNNQGNAFGNNVAMRGNNANQVNGSFASNSSFSNSLYNNQLNNLNSMPYDDRTALEKMFSSDERFKSKAELNAEKAMKNNQKRNSFAAALENSLNSNSFSNNKNNSNFNQNMMNNMNNMQQRGPMPGNQPMMNQGMQQPMMNQPMMNQVMQQQGPMNQPNQPQMFSQRMAQRKQQNQKKTGIKDKLLGKVKDIKKSIDKKSAQKVNRMPKANMQQPMMPKTNVQQPMMPNMNNQNLNQQKMNQPAFNIPNSPVKEKKIPNINQQNIKLPKEKPPDLPKAKEKLPINWGNDLVKDEGKDKLIPKDIKANTIFNIVALIISIVGVLFVYFKFIRNDDKGKVSTFGGLRYSINNNFILKDEKNNYRLYNYGESCSIGISYGATNAVSTYVDDLYESIKGDFDSQNYKVSKSSTKYNDNVWTEINVVVLANNVASANGYSTQTKIQYVAIVYEGNYYTIGYQNTNNNTICSASYDSFLKSLAFK